MKYTPLKNRKANMTVLVALLLVFSVFLLLNAMLDSYRFLCQVGALITVTVFIQITARYELPIYSYIIDKNNFAVVREQGKKVSQLCNVDLTTGIAIMKKDEYKALPGERKRKITKCYNFCQNIFADSYYYIFEFNGWQGLIIAELSEAMAAEIKRIIDNTVEADEADE